MDRIRTIISYEWRAYWRRFSRAGLRSGTQGVILILSLLLSVKYMQLVLRASAEPTKGDTRLLGLLLVAVFLAWWFPLAGSSRQTLASRTWLHLPLSLKERFVLRTVSLMMPPSAWLVFAGSLAVCYPLGQGRNPWAGIAAGLLWIATGWSTGLTISHLLNSAAWRKWLYLAALALLAIAGVYVTRGGAPAEMLSVQFVPARLVVQAAVGANAEGVAAVALLGMLAASTALAALWSFNKSLKADPYTGTRRMIIGSIFPVPGRLGALVAKDVRYFRKLLDIYIGVAAGLLGCVYLIVAEVPSAGIFWSFIIAVFLGNAALAFNGFGLDNGAGLARYALLPLSGSSILLSKNFAYALIVGLQILPMVLIAAWRLGIIASTLGLIVAASVGSAYLAWGNWMTVSHPLKMQFYRFAGSGAALVDEMGGIVFGSIPGIAMIYLLNRGGGSAEVIAGMALIVSLTGALYLISVNRFGARFDRKREQIAEALI